MEQIDLAVGAMLAWKFDLGLFEDPYFDEGRASAAVRADGRRALALRAAEESIVLLKNDGGFLPLALERLGTIAVIGPNADIVRLGGYSGSPLEPVSILAGIRSRVAGRAEVLHAQGCVLVKDEPPTAYERSKTEVAVLATDEENRPLIEEAARVAARADVVILALGETESLCREAYSNGVVGDVTSLDLPGSQPELVRAVLAAGKPVVTYLMNGRPLVLGELAARSPAILEGWYMGQETGTAVARILFGDTVPSGKLTISFPKSVGHIPVYHSKRPYAGPFPYVFSDNEPVYPFGHGLSYTTFAYSNPRLRDSEIGRDGATVASIDVTNTGKREADEIVQMYVAAQVSGVTRPVRELKGFLRVRLKPGETRTIPFPVDAEALAFWNIDMKLRVEPGTYQILMGTSSAASEGATLTVRA
jgi:beta-glucosidase